MNLRHAPVSLSKHIFRVIRAVASIFPGGRMEAFGSGNDMIGSILIVNLDRQPHRLRRVLDELGRFQTSDGSPLTSITRRFAAVDARDGRAVAATADVDPVYSMRDQLHVQPDARLEECFGIDEPIRMTRQEVAIARSHVEVWKAISIGSDNFVLVLEDDVWFRRGAAAEIDQGWREALRRCRSIGGPHLLYFSYADADGTVERTDICDHLFRPIRGLWFLSGYVLSREGAAALLRAMPVVGPVDTWINYRFGELGALALSSPAILQRPDSTSDNSYSILPYLARAGIVDAGSGTIPPDQTHARSLLAWSAVREQESLAMALSMLGLRVRVFDGDEKALEVLELLHLFDIFDILVDPPLVPGALSAIIAREDVRFILETPSTLLSEIEPEQLPSSRTTVLSQGREGIRSWETLCNFLDLAVPAQAFPVGAPREMRVFRDDRSDAAPKSVSSLWQKDCPQDSSPWILPPRSGWAPRPFKGQSVLPTGKHLLQAAMTTATTSFLGLVETFPGNLASFEEEGLFYSYDGAHLVISEASSGIRPYRSGAFASANLFEHGHFEAEIRAASGSGLVTGFFLHRDSPRQEIDVELAGGDPRRMLINVYFNPGDDGATIGFGYRGSPCRIDLDFDATLDFHLYAIDWQPNRISWSVDGKVVHERVGWDPTPIPHLPMRLHANLWAPRSEDLAGRINNDALPSTAIFRNLSVRQADHTVQTFLRTNRSVNQKQLTA